MIDILNDVLIGFQEAFTTGPFVYVWFFLGKTWWLFVPLFLVMSVWWYWVDYIETIYIVHVMDFRLIAVTVPKDIVGTPKAMEQVFTAAAGMMHGITLVDHYWGGMVSEFFSAELVGIEGHIRYIFRMPAGFIDLFEPNIDAQYPDAEIMEREDYTQMVPDDWLDKGYDTWGTELALTREDAYPLRTYPEFEERITQGVLDPMAGITELMGRLGKGEQLWVQWVCKPVGPHEWVPEGEKLRDVLLEKVSPDERSKMLEALTAPLNQMGNIVEQAMGGFEHIQGGDEDGGMLMMSPDLYNILLALDRSLNKQGFMVKARVLYMSKNPDTFMISRGISGFMGYLSQFNAQNLNGFKPDGRSKTKIEYFLKDYRLKLRKNALLQRCKTRSMWRGCKLFILNAEELATVFHFPMPEAKAQMIERVEAKKSGPPRDLPIVG